MEKNIRIGWLLDFYGEFLTQRQRRLMELHYNDDLSLGEIASGEGITRQGVHDALRRGEETLESCESRLRLLERYLAVKDGIEALSGFLDGKASLDPQETERVRAALAGIAGAWEGNNGL